MNSTHNKGKSEIAEKVSIILLGKIYKNVTTNSNKSYLGYFGKLVDE